MVNPDMDKLNALVGKMLGDLGGAFSVPTVRIGFKLGSFKAPAEARPLTAPALAEHTGLDERYVREWAMAQVAYSYVSLDPAQHSFS